MTTDRTPAQAELSEVEVAILRHRAHWMLQYERLLLRLLGEYAESRASRDAATTELAHVRVELVACQAERDTIEADHGELITETVLLREQVRVLEDELRQANVNMQQLALGASTKGNC